MTTTKDLNNLIANLQSTDPKIREKTIFSLAEFDSENIIDILLNQLNDPVSEVQKAVVCVLGETKSEKTIPPLISFLENDNYELRWEAAQALAEMKPSPEIIAHLIVQLEKETVGNVKVSIIRALGTLAPNSQVIIKPLLQCLNDKNKAVQLEANCVLMDNSLVAQLLEEAQSVAVNEQKTSPSHLERVLKILKTRTNSLIDSVETTFKIFNQNANLGFSPMGGNDTSEQLASSPPITINEEDYQLKIKVDNDSYQFSLSHAEKGYVVPKDFKLTVTTLLNKQTTEYEAEYLDGLLTLSIPLQEYDEVIWQTQPLPDNLN